MDPSKLTHEDLEWYVGDGFLGSNFKDKTSWIGAEDPSQNMTKGIRVVVRVRGCVNSTSTSFPRALSTWKKTTWIRARGGQGRAPGRWNLVEHMVPIGEASQLDDKFVHLVQFHFPDRAWSSSEKNEHVGMMVTSDLKPMNPDRTPPNPPKPKRVLDSEKDLGAPKSRMKDPHEGLEGAKTLGHTKDEVETFSDTSSGTISPCKLEEVTKDIDMWEKKGVKVEQVEEQPHQTVCFVGVLEDAKTSTMTKRQKRAFVSGLESLQHHDQVMNGCFSHQEHFGSHVQPQDLRPSLHQSL